MRLERAEKAEEKKLMEVLSYGTDSTSKITASLTSTHFKGFYKPLGRLNKDNIIESKKRARALILAKINGAVKKKAWLRMQWKKIQKSPWAQRKMDRVEMLMKLEKEIKEQKRIEIAHRNELKQLIVGKDDPK